jgi:hypothetical protein
VNKKNYYQLSRSNLPSLINRAASASDNGILVPFNPSGGGGSVSLLSAAAGGILNESPPLLTVNFGPFSGFDSVFRAFVLAPGDLAGSVVLDVEGVGVPVEVGLPVNVGVDAFGASGRTKNLGPFEDRCAVLGLEGTGVSAI